VQTDVVEPADVVDPVQPPGVTVLHVLRAVGMHDSVLLYGCYVWVVAQRIDLAYRQLPVEVVDGGVIRTSV
jgi:hypothetical protein